MGYWISCAPSDAITRNHHQVPEVTLTGADRRIYVSERKHGKRVDGRPSLSPCYVHIYIYICAAFYIIIPLERIIYYSIQVLSSHIFFIALPSIQRQVSSGSFGSSRASAGGLRPSPAAFASSSSWPRCSANHVGTFVLWPACSKLRVGCGCQISGGARRPCG